MRRRHFLQLAAAGLATPRWATAFAAAPASGSKTVLVFLRGGYDAASLLVPLSSDFYEEVRPHIGIARRGEGLDVALPLNTDWGLHPALRESLYPLYQQKQLAFVPFAGTPDLSRSHFETQDSIEMGQGNGRDFGSGFLNRLCSVLASPRPISFTDQLPVIFRGHVDVPNTALRTLSRPALDARQSKIVASMYENTALAHVVNEGFETRDAVMQEMAGEMEGASRNAASSKGFELEARRIARLMRERYDIAFVDVGGWDTHVGQGAASGYLANRLDELGRGLAALASELGDVWSRTTVVVISEFGRTFRENGNRGTDHGHGSVYWFLGGAIRGGQVLGRQQALTAASLFQNRDYPVLSDYRDLLAGLYGRQFGLSSAQLQQVFPGAQPLDVGII
jgi:uncharacterized protein (DUF1501 family)